MPLVSLESWILSYSLDAILKQYRDLCFIYEPVIARLLECKKKKKKEAKILGPRD